MWQWLHKDTSVYTELDDLIKHHGWTGRDVFLYIGQGNGPQGLYDSFATTTSNFRDVDWEQIVRDWTTE